MIKIFSEVLIYIFSFGISDLIMSTLPNKKYKFLFILFIGIVGFSCYLKYNT